MEVGLLSSCLYDKMIHSIKEDGCLVSPGAVFSLFNYVILSSEPTTAKQLEDVFLCFTE